MELGEHISEEATEQHAMKNLPESEIEPLEKHLLICPLCQDRLREMDEFLAALRAAASKTAQDAPPEDG